MAPVAGLFGKLPRHGDFLRRGMADAVADRWDAWLSRELDHQKHRLGDRFEAAHDAGPCLRFLLRGHDGWRLGVVCPSIDSVRRRFFLLLELDGLTDGEALAWGGEVARRLEDLAYRALAETMDADALLAEVRAVGVHLPSLEAAAWTSLGAGAAGDGVWWREACERAAAECRPASWLREGDLEMMFIEPVTEGVA